MRKNFGTNPYFFPLPVLIVGSYDPVERSYRVLGKTVGKAFAVGSELK